MYEDTVALALHDPDKHEAPPLRETKLQKGAYFYPVSQRTQLKPRPKDMPVEVVEEVGHCDVIYVNGKDVEEGAERLAHRQRFRADEDLE